MGLCSVIAQTPLHHCITAAVRSATTGVSLILRRLGLETTDAFPSLTQLPAHPCRTPDQPLFHAAWAGTPLPPLLHVMSYLASPRTGVNAYAHPLWTAHHVPVLPWP